MVASPRTLERYLRAALDGDVLFDAFSRGRYATDASHYQAMPVGVVVPRHAQDLAMALKIAREEGSSVLARGGGTSQAGQTVNQSIVIDTSKHLNRILEVDPENRRCVVEPGIVLDELNRALKPHGLWFPVDVSTASRATLGGMAANNSCGARSLRYGTTRDNVISIDAVLADGTRGHFGPVAADLSDIPAGSPLRGSPASWSPPGTARSWRSWRSPCAASGVAAAGPTRPATPCCVRPPRRCALACGRRTWVRVSLQS